MLAGARLRDDALLAHAPRQQNLPQHIVDLVRAGVVELVALEIDLGAEPIARLVRRCSVMRSAKYSGLGRPT